MPSVGYAKSIANAININEEMLSPIAYSVFSRGSLVGRIIWMSKNPGRNVSSTKPRTCLRMGISNMMDISVKAINDSVSRQTLFESKIGTITS
jgi:hypothetical protein